MADRPLYEPGVRYVPSIGSPTDEWRDSEMLDCVDPEVTERVLLHDREELRRLWRDHGSRIAYHRVLNLPLPGHAPAFGHRTVSEIDGDDARIAGYMARMLVGRSDAFGRAYHELACRVIPRMLAADAAVPTTPRDPPFHIQVIWPDGEGPEDPVVATLRHDAGMSKSHIHTTSKAHFRELLSTEVGSSRSDNFGPPWGPFAAGDTVVLHERADVDATLTGRVVELLVVEVVQDPTWSDGQIVVLRRTK